MFSCMLFAPASKMYELAARKTGAFSNLTVEKSDTEQLQVWLILQLINFYNACTLVPKTFTEL